MLARLAAFLLVLVFVAGCGGDDSAPARASGQFSPAAVSGIVAVEEIRAELAVAADLAALGRRDASKQHLGEARALWSALAAGVRGGDPVLAREVDVAFERASDVLRVATSFDPVRDRISPLLTQLMGGVREELVPDKRARLDPAVNAAALIRLLDHASEEYAAGRPRRLEHAFGLVDRSQAVAREVATSLGPRRDAVVEGLKRLRDTAFPDELETAPADLAPPADFASRAAKIRAALEARFNL